MLYQNNLTLKELDIDRTERRVGFRKITDMLTHFIHVATSYDAESDNSNYFSLSLNLSPTSEVKVTKTVNKSGEKVTENEYKKEGQVKQEAKKLFSGNAESYLK